MTQLRIVGRDKPPEEFLTVAGEHTSDSSMGYGGTGGNPCLVYRFSMLTDAPW